MKLDAGSLALTGKDSRYNEAGSLSLDKGATLKGVDLSGVKGNVTYNAGLDGAGVTSLLTKFSTANSDQLSALSGLFDKQQQQIGTLAKTAQTTDEDRKNKLVFWIALAALAVATFILWPRRS